MRFQVPQFIEVEDKIVGPLTITQFIFLAGGGGFLVALWLLLPVWLAILLGSPVAILGLALAFYKVNDRPFILTLQSAIEYVLKDKLYIWNKEERQVETAVETQEKPEQLVPAATASKIKDLAWSLDVKESPLYSDTKQK